MKRLFSIFTAIIILALGSGVFAAECVREAETNYNCCHESTFIKGYILNGITERQGEVSLEGMGLDKAAAKKVIEEVISENSRESASVLSFEVNENATVAVFEYDEVLSLCEIPEVLAEKEKIFSLIDDDMTDMEKALVVHDYMAQNYEYDTTYSIYSAEGIFKNKKGVCQAYALAYIEIMKKLQIECKFVPSDAMNHAWNLIKIDGEWYHIDVTWDDPTPDLLGRVWHKFFLVSDSAIGSTEYFKSPHYSWKISEKATSTKYDGFFWYDVEKPIIDKNGYWYYIKTTDTKPKKGQIIRRNVTTNSETVIYTIDEIWKVWGDNSRYWNSCFSGIGIYGDKIYFNTPVAIKRIKLNGKSPETVYKPDTSAGYIYGIVANDGKITYGISTSPNNGIEAKYDYHMVYSIYFDANGGESDTGHKTVAYNTNYGTLPVPYREGYTFEGWYTKKEGGTLITENSVMKTEEDHTLYALWKKIPAEIEVEPKKEEGKCIVSVNPKWVEEECFIYVACFKGGKLSHIERRLYSGSEEKFTADDGSDVKIMLWGCDELSNVCSKILIGKSEFK